MPKGANVGGEGRDVRRVPLHHFVVCRAWPGCLLVRSASVPTSNFVSSVRRMAVQINEQVQPQVGNTEG